MSYVVCMGELNLACNFLAMDLIAIVISPVHVVLVSLLVDQLSGLFLIFFGRQKKIVQSQEIFGQSLGIFG